MDNLLSPQQLADYLGVPVATVYGWRYKREGPVGVRIGRHVRFRRADVLEWIEQQKDERDAERVRA